jgi:hypothetical protein
MLIPVNDSLACMGTVTTPTYVTPVGLCQALVPQDCSHHDRGCTKSVCYLALPKCRMGQWACESSSMVDKVASHDYCSQFLAFWVESYKVFPRFRSTLSFRHWEARWLPQLYSIFQRNMVRRLVSFLMRVWYFTQCCSQMSRTLRFCPRWSRFFLSFICTWGHYLMDHCPKCMAEDV